LQLISQVVQSCRIPAHFQENQAGAAHKKS
jgi:hypothetical protein